MLDWQNARRHQKWWIAGYGITCDVAKLTPFNPWRESNLRVFGLNRPNNLRIVSLQGLKWTGYRYIKGNALAKNLRKRHFLSRAKDPVSTHRIADEFMQGWKWRFPDEWSSEQDFRKHCLRLLRAPNFGGFDFSPIYPIHLCRIQSESYLRKNCTLNIQTTLVFGHCPLWMGDAEKLWCLVQTTKIRLWCWHYYYSRKYMLCFNLEG